MSSMKKGYKLTELGEIPEDWQLKTFADVMTGFSSGQTPSRAIPEYYKGDIRWITSGELNYNVITDTIEKITPEAVRRTNLKILPKGTFLIAITGLEAEGTRGSCGIVGEEATTNQSCMALYPKKGLDNEYLRHFYVKYGNWLAFKYCQGTKQQSYTGKIARILPIILPPTKEEQIAIAKALSDIDTFISSLQKLIVKKKDIKQGAMQALLTGTVRLHGFNDNWVLKTLGNVAKIKTGKRNNEDKVPDGIYPFFVRSQTVERINSFSFNGEAVLVPGEGGIGTIIHYINGRFDYHQRVYKISNFSDDVCGKFIYYCMMQNFNDHATKNSVKATVDSLRLPTFQEFEFLSPSFDEQTAIAKALTEMDEEINALEKKLSKFQNLKEGMMQDLLTGKRRLTLKK